MIEIEYIHTEEKLDNPSIRRTDTLAMKKYIQDLVFEMQMADISCSFKEKISETGPNTVLINKKSIPEILDGLEIKMLEVEDSCDMGSSGRVTFGRPVLDWNKDFIEDIPDTLMKNAIAKVFADMNKNKIDLIN